MSKSKFSFKNLLFFIVTLAAAAAAIAGLFLPAVTIGGENDTVNSFIQTLLKELGEEPALFDLSDTWGTITIICGCATAAFSAIVFLIALSKFAKIGKTRNIEMLLSFLALIFGILTLVSAFIYCGNLTKDIPDAIEKFIKSAPDVGIYLIAAGGVVAGIGGFLNKSSK